MKSCRDVLRHNAFIRRAYVTIDCSHTRCAGRECASHYHRGTYQQWFARFNHGGITRNNGKEARDRVRSAIINSGYEFPAKKITINLAPADLPKEGGRYDLPIAVALLAASEQLTPHNLDTYELVGELALTGALRGVPGAISSATEAIRAGRRIIVAKENAAEVGLIHGEGCLIADHLQAVCAFLEGKHDLDRPSSADFTPCALTDDLSDVIGQNRVNAGWSYRSWRS